MRYIAVLMLTVLMTAFTACEKDTNINAKNDITALKLNGKIKSIRETAYPAVVKNGKVFKENRADADSITNFTNFNEKGFKYESGMLDSNGIPSRTTLFIYSTNDRVIEEMTYMYYASNPEQVTTYKHDKHGNTVEEINYTTYSRQCSNKLVRTFDKKGNSIEENYYEPCDTKESYFVLKYDDRGNVIEKASYSAEGMPDSNQEAVYDSNSNLIEKISHLQDADVSGRTTYKYDDKGNCTESIKYNFGGTVSSKTKYRYEFDSRGNWIKQIIYTNGTASEIKEREIKYYD